MEWLLVMRFRYDRVSKREHFTFKVDFEKTYDSVNWPFLDYLLRGFGFEDRWRVWIFF